jgi:hypothetical protein
MEGMDPGQRVELLKEAATLLAKREWAELDLILDQFGFGTTDFWEGDDKFAYAIAMTKVGENGALYKLHQYLTGESKEAPIGPQPWEQGRFRLFMSHLAKHQNLVGAIADPLASYGISAFVAHDTIEPSAEWQDVIEAALRSCDAMAVFLHDGVHESWWCDQEIGFAMARRVPILPLKYDLDPYGFIGKFQAEKCIGLTPGQVADRIVDWLVRTPSAHAHWADGLAWALENSGSYDNTRRIMRVLEQIPSFTPEQMRRLESATRDNNQVSDAVLDQVPVPKRIQNLITARGGSLTGSGSQATSGWNAEPPY